MIPIYSSNVIIHLRKVQETNVKIIWSTNASCMLCILCIVWLRNISKIADIKYAGICWTIWEVRKRCIGNIWGNIVVGYHMSTVCYVLSNVMWCMRWQSDRVSNLTGINYNSTWWLFEPGHFIAQTGLPSNINKVWSFQLCIYI